MTIGQRVTTCFSVKTQPEQSGDHNNVDYQHTGHLSQPFVYFFEYLATTFHSWLYDYISDYGKNSGSLGGY